MILVGSILLAVLAVCLASNSAKIVSLNDNWKLKVINCVGQPMSEEEMQVSVPMTIHLALLNNKRIQDTFLGGNWQKQRWISDCDAEFTTKFKLEKDTLNAFTNIEVVLEGIDTYAKINLNGIQIGSSINAFVEFRREIKSHLNYQGQNILKISIESTKNHDDDGQRRDPMPFPYAHTRKACYQYSWDWAPFMNTLGIWKPVYLNMFHTSRINYVWARNRLISNQKAVINFAVVLTQMPVQQIESFEIRIILNGRQVATKSCKQLTQYIDVNIHHPRLWWPRGFGEAYIYDFEVRLMNGGTEVHKKFVPYGIRSITLDHQDKDFQFYINGHKIYAKGANYVPMDMQYPRLNNPNHMNAYNHTSLFDDMVESNFNMIRLWGGGQYESDEFYQLASRRGILLFFDFMFSDSIYPSTEAFLRNVEKEVIEQVRRVRNYPALALFSGNNEILQGILQWGWGTQKYKIDYHRLFEKLIPQILEYEAPDIDYIPSSPKLGLSNYNSGGGGDAHYWGVWAGGSEMESYEQSVGYFNSEFGTQALPVWETIKQMVPDPQGVSLSSSQLAAHERHGSGFGTLQSYHSIYTFKTDNFQHKVFMSGIVQAFGVSVAIIAQRLAKEVSRGTLYWQLNDAWPAISWAAIDYYGRWKPLQYAAKSLYSDVVLLYNKKKNAVFLLNDKPYEATVYAAAVLLDLNGTVISSKNSTEKVAPNSMISFMPIQIGFVTSKNHILRCQTMLSREETSVTTFIFVRPNALNTSNEPKISVTVNSKENYILVKAEKVVKNLYIASSKTYIRLNQNYFDVIPGYENYVTIVKGGTVKEHKDSLTFTHMNSMKNGVIIDPIIEYID